MKLLKTVLSIVAIGLLANQVLGANEEVKRGSVYWSANKSTPSDTVQEVLRFTNNRDYFSLYALISMDVVSDLNRSINRYSSEIWGIKVNLGDIIVSEVGRRYGKIAVFEEVMRKSCSTKQSWVWLVAQRRNWVKGNTPFETAGEDGAATVTISSDAGDVVFFVVQSDNGSWHLDNVKWDSNLWR